MVARITLILDDETAGGFRQLLQNAERADASIEELEADTKRLAKAVDNVGKESASWGNLSERVTAVSSAVSAGISTYNAMREHIMKAREAIRSLAETGSPAFVELNGALDDLRNSFIELANDPSVQGWAQSLATSIREDLVPAIGNLHEERARLVDGLAEGLTWLGTKIGVVSEETHQAAVEMLQQGRKMREAERDELRKQRLEAEALKETEQKRAMVQQAFDRLRRASDREAAAERVASLQSLERINEELKTQENLLRKLAFSGDATPDKVREIEEEIVMLRRQRLKVTEQEAAAEAQAAAARQQQHDEWVANLAAVEKQAQAAKAAEHEKQMQETQAAINALQQALGQAKGADGADLIQQARGGIGQKQILDQIVKQRQAERQQMFDEQQLGLSPAEQKRQMKEIQQQVFREARLGGRGNVQQISQQEIVKAQNTLTQQIIEQTVKGGQFGQVQVEALSKAAEAAATAAENEARLSEQVDQISKQLSKVIESQRGTATRSRSQQGRSGR